MSQSRRSSSGGSSSSSLGGAFNVKTLTPYLTHGTARTLNGLAALLVVAGLILVAQVSAQVRWAGGRVGSRGWRCPRHRRGHGRDRRGVAGIVDQKQRRGLHQTPIRTDVDVSRKTEIDRNVPERPKKNDTLSLKTSAHDAWEREFYADDSPANLLAALVAKTDATDGDEWSQIRRCGGNSKPLPPSAVKTCSKGRRREDVHQGPGGVYAAVRKPLATEPSASGKGTKGRRPKARGCSLFPDFQARRGVGLGHQQEYLARWLMFGMATRRAVFFQFCAEDGEPWELHPSAFNPPPPPATYVGMDISTPAIISV